jgi:serine/threonine protein kinase
MESNKINNRNIKDVYKIESTIGRGSFSTVKKIKNRKTKEYFAVKVYSKSKISEEENEIIQTEI